MAITIQNHELQVTLKALGATMTSITDSQGVEYLWQGEPTYWGGQAPILFPNAEVFEMIASFTDQLKLHILRVSYQGMALYVTKHSTMITYRILLFVLQLKVVKKR